MAKIFIHKICFLCLAVVKRAFHVLCFYSLADSVLYWQFSEQGTYGKGIGKQICNK